MTANQIAYQRNLIEQRKNRELERSNWAQETETNRSNLAKEAEMHRANRASETLRGVDSAIKALQAITSAMKTAGDISNAAPLVMGA